MFYKKLFRFIVIFLFIPTLANASLEQVWSSLKTSRGNVAAYPKIATLLVNEGLYFTAVPFLKEYLISNRGKVNKRNIDELIDEVISEVGVKQFEVLPVRFLSRSNAPTIRYILARKLFRKGRYKSVLQTLNASIPRNHSVKPFALLLEGSTFSLQGKHLAAVEAYKECISISEDRLDNEENQNKTRQLKINRDYCIIGIARSQFASKKYEAANLSYLDLPKSSYIWPEILFEEAWNSFYQKDYNRTLGKLVTYKAPFFDYIFNPEIDVLRALTYLELCLYKDVRDVVDSFYKNYEKEHDQLERFIQKHKKDYRYYYLLGKSSKDGKVRANKLLNSILKAISRDPSYIEIYQSFQQGRNELKRVNNISNIRLKKYLLQNVKESLLLQRNLIGAYVRKEITSYHREMKKAFENMSYLKLEVLNQKKQALYSTENKQARGRGDVKNLSRTDKQYFWTFNGEFWADELGDYVFSLKSSCK